MENFIHQDTYRYTPQPYSLYNDAKDNAFIPLVQTIVDKNE